MKTSKFKQCIFSVCLTLLCVPSTSHAEIYKWTDANGQTHYSEKKADADKAKALQLKVKSGPISTQATDPLMQNLQEQERQFKTRQGQNQNGNSFRPPAETRPKSLSGGNVDETSDASQCNLARDVLSGAVKHRNGAKTDDNDIEVAKNDIRAFCH
jgi:hypothetical protein